MTRKANPATALLFLFIITSVAVACDESGEEAAFASIKNDFDNPEMSFNPPWTVCKSSYMGIAFGEIQLGQTSEEKQVDPGLDYVLMVLAWDDPDCNPENCLPVASRNEEEIVAGQHREIAINLPNHQGPCPPEGVQPITEDLYNRILDLWPEYNFKPYNQKAENEQCLD